MKVKLLLIALLLVASNGWAEPIGIGCIHQDNPSKTYNWEFVIDGEKKNAQVIYGKNEDLYHLIYNDYPDSISIILNHSLIFPYAKTRLRWLLDKDSLTAIAYIDNGNGIYQRGEGEFFCFQDDKVLSKAIDSFEKEKEKKKKRLIQ